jgi:hypothetical protein
LPPDVDITEFVKVELPPEPVSAADGADQKASLFARNLALIRKMMGILIACVLFFWVMDLWGPGLPLGRSIVQSAASIFATLLIAYAVWEMDDSAMILRIKFKTKPGDQFMARREVYRRVQEKFRAQDIEFAHRNVTVYLPLPPPEASGAPAGSDGQGEDLGPLSAVDRKILEAGAAAAITASQAEEFDDKPKK